LNSSPQETDLFRPHAGKRKGGGDSLNINLYDVEKRKKRKKKEGGRMRRSWSLEYLNNERTGQVLWFFL